MRVLVRCRVIQRTRLGSLCLDERLGVPRMCVGSDAELGLVKTVGISEKSH